MKYLGEVKKLLEGDNAELYLPYGRLMLGQLKERMKMLNLQQLQWQKILAGGVLVFVSSVFGQDTIQVVVPPINPIENPQPPVDEESIYTREIPFQSDDFYYYAGVVTARDLFWELSNNASFKPLNDLYRYRNGELELIAHYDFGVSHSHGIAVNNNLIMICYTTEDENFVQDKVIINFYSKNSPEKLIKSYTFDERGSQPYAWCGRPVFHNGEFKVAISLIERAFYVFDQFGNLKDDFYPFDNTYSQIPYLISLSLNVTDDNRLVIQSENFDGVIPDATSEIYTIFEIDDDYNLVNPRHFLAPSMTSTGADLTDYGGFYGANIAFFYTEGRFSYGKKSKIAITSTYNSFTKAGFRFEYTEIEKRLIRNTAWLYFRLTGLYVDANEVLEAPDSVFFADPFYNLIEFDLQGNIISNIEIPAGQNYASTAIGKTNTKKIYTYKVVNGVENLIGIDVYEVVEDSADIFLYKEL